MAPVKSSPTVLTALYLIYITIILSPTASYGFSFVKHNALAIKNAMTSKNAMSRHSIPPLAATVSSSVLVEPSQRDGHYGEPLNVAQYLVDLHDAKATFDFCGGMMFQLVLSDQLREHLVKVSSEQQQQQQPIIFDNAKSRMFQIPEYSQTGQADNIRIFHGREIRKVPHANGGMGFVLHLSLANGKDPEGWTAGEINGYDGWEHDVGRDWRVGKRLEEEGFADFRTKFGLDSFSLNHRFYLHFDGGKRMWLSAEDGCEGTPSDGDAGFFKKMFGF